VATLQSHNPAAPEELVFAVQESSEAEVSAQLDAAIAAWAGWRADSPWRAASLEAFADALAARAERFAALMVREVGKPLAEARGEVARAEAILRYHAQAALGPSGETFPGSTPGAEVLVSREPLGAVLAICPWNFPLAIPLWKAAPALAYGNVVLMKPATPGLAVAELIAEAAAEALPENVLSLVHLSGARSAELLDDERVAAVTFTGSTAVGLSVAARMAARAAPAQCEMGGQNPAIVLSDADPEAAAAAIVAGAMGYAGQKCTATRRAIAVGAVAAPLQAALVEQVRALAVGRPELDGVVVGPLIDASAVDEFEQRVSAALAAGASELARAEVPAELGTGDASTEARAVDAPGGSGYFVSPALLAEDDPQAEVNQLETFGPLLTLLRVDDEEEALAVANSTRFGLVGAVHGRDLGRARAVAARLQCGMRRVNAPTPGVDYYAPFGGDGLSGFGPREQGRAAREFFTAARTTTVLPPP
jgi:alpha-ketoglutaric semialdehyde dehydrogenase